SFTDADTNPSQHDLPESSRQTGEHRHDAPQEYADTDQTRARASIRQPRDGNTRDGVENRENAIHPRDLTVAYVQIGLNRSNDDGSNLPIDVGNYRAKYQHADDEPGVSAAWVAFRRIGLVPSRRGQVLFEGGRVHRKPRYNSSS